MSEGASDIDWTGVGIVLLVFFVIPALALFRGGEAPIYAFGLLLVVGTYILVFRREWWWRPLCAYLVERKR